MQNSSLSFLDHLEALRWHLIRALAGVVLITIIVFLNKTFVFDHIMLAPKQNSFWTYQVLCDLSRNAFLGEALCLQDIPFTITNIDMAGQFLLHIKVSVVLGIILAFPYVFFELWRFIGPGLYEQEKRYTKGIVIFSSLFFFIGVLFGYFILTPFSINFLGSYHVSEQVQNTINLSSYISTITMLVLASGLVFELPMAVFILSKIGLVTPDMMRQYRKHAFIIILILSAMITPPDVTSQLLIGVPLYLLYEVSIFISARVNPKENL